MKSHYWMIYVVENLSTASLETIVWNYLDTDHAPYVHKSYVSAELLERNANVRLTRQVYRWFGFHFTHFHWFCFQPPSSFRVRDISPGGEKLVLTQIIDEANHRRIRTEYRWELPFWLKPFEPILKKIILRRHKQLLKEDEAVRARRDLVKNRGFKDWAGLTLPST